MEHEAGRKLSHHQAAAEEGAADWDDLWTTWQQVRRAIEQAVAENPNGFDPQHLADLRMQELRAWKRLQNATALRALDRMRMDKL
jgi:hypothetical protein